MQFPPLDPHSPDLKNLSFDELVNEIERENQANFQPSKLFDDPEQVGDGDADPQHWARMSYWSGAEIAALSLGKNPTVVNENTCREGVTKYQLCRDFWDRLEIVHRAIEAEQIFAQTIPTYALAWLERYKIKFPLALKREVENLGLQVADWKTFYDDVVARAGHLENALKDADNELQSLSARNQSYSEWTDRALASMSQQNQVLQHQSAEIENLHFRIAELERALEAANDETLHPRERNSLLKILLGIAIEQYDYSPNDKKSKAPGQIVSDLAEHGLDVSDDTIRKYLNEGAEKHYMRDTE